MRDEEASVVTAVGAEGHVYKLDGRVHRLCTTDDVGDLACTHDGAVGLPMRHSALENDHLCAAHKSMALVCPLRLAQDRVSGLHGGVLTLSGAKLCAAAAASCLASVCARRKTVRTTETVPVG